MSDVKKIFGIDLGTTYSCIAHTNKHGEPEIIPNSEGDLTTPSVVFFENETNVIVGKVAKQEAEKEPDRVADFVKRSMGDDTFQFEVDGKKYLPEEVSAHILRKLVQDASVYLNEPITDVVITCPAYFGIKERAATKNAGIIAGLNVHEVLNEPTAAAFNYGLDRAEGNQTVLVYDLGGGTFDVTMIKITDKAEGEGKDIEVISSGGDHQLGGKDWDDRIIEFFASSFMNEHGEDQDPRDDRNSMQDLRNKAEDAKKMLSAREKYKTVVDYNQLRTEIELSRETFEAITKDLADRTIELTRSMMEDAKDKGHSEIDRILLVGGSTRMPMIVEAIKNELGQDPMLYEPDQAVAKGAALFGFKKFVEGIIGEVGKDPDKVREEAEKAGVFISGDIDINDITSGSIVNVSSKAFGVVVVRFDANNQEEKYVFNMLDRHARLPVEHIETGFGTLYANQTGIDIELMEQADGNSDFSESLEHNIKIGEGKISGLPAGLPAGSPVHITFRLEEDGRLSVYVVEPNSGKECTIVTQIEGVLSEEEVRDRATALQQIHTS